MVTRKSGDGSRGLEDGGGDRPGSYAKTSSSRRKRKGKRGRSTNPPAPSLSSSPPAENEQSAEQALDVEGEEVESRPRGRVTQPDWGGAGDDNAVDDLRRKPTSSRAPRKALGPLGMEEAQLDSPTSSVPPRISTPRPSAPNRLNVVEINPEQISDNTNGSPYGEEPASDPFGDPWEHERDASEPPEPVRTPRTSRAPDGERAHGQAAALRSDAVPRRSTAPSARSQLQPDALELYRDEDARPSLSSVFGARPSLRPSPPPPAAQSASIVWWVVVTLLSGIIIAAGVIALREAQGAQRAESAPGPAAVDRLPAQTHAGDVVPATPEPAAERSGVAAPGRAAPQAPPASARAPVTNPPAASTPAVRSAGPATASAPQTAPRPPAPSVTMHTAPLANAGTTRPVVAPPRPVPAAKPVASAAPAPASTESAEIVVPAAWRPATGKPAARVQKPQAPAVLNPRLPRPTHDAVPAPEPVVTAPPAPAAEPQAADERLPQNPYR